MKRISILLAIATMVFISCSLFDKDCPECPEECNSEKPNLYVDSLAFDHVKISWDNAGQVKKTGGNH